MNRLTIIALTLVVTLGLVTAGYTAYQDRMSPDEAGTAHKTVHASIAIEGMLPAEFVFMDTDVSALSLLKTVAESNSIPMTQQEYAGLGTLVESIGDKHNGADGKYWLYYVNGAVTPVGADAYTVQNGDVIEWVFAAPEATL